MPESKPFAVEAGRTIKVLEEYGWHQGAYGPCVHPEQGGHDGWLNYRASGAHCLLGAIFELHLSYPQAEAFVNAVSLRIAQIESDVAPFAQGRIIDWNDFPERTYAEVIDLLQQLV